MKYGNYSVKCICLQMGPSVTHSAAFQIDVSSFSRVFVLAPTPPVVTRFRPTGAELDLPLTADVVSVLMHDDTLDQSASEAGRCPPSQAGTASNSGQLLCFMRCRRSSL